MGSQIVEEVPVVGLPAEVLGSGNIGEVSHFISKFLRSLDTLVPTIVQRMGRV